MFFNIQKYYLPLDSQSVESTFSVNSRSNVKNLSKPEPEFMLMFLSPSSSQLGTKSYEFNFPHISWITPLLFISSQVPKHIFLLIQASPFTQSHPPKKRIWHCHSVALSISEAPPLLQFVSSCLVSHCLWLCILVWCWWSCISTIVFPPLCLI